MADATHIMLIYKGDISALTLFCQWPQGDICFPPLPKLAAIVEDEDFKPQPVELFPKKLLSELNSALQLDDDLLDIEPGFYEQVELASGIVTVYMARFRLLDPPHKLMAERQCKMQPLTSLIGRPPAEMELLRRAYIQMMED